MTDQTETPDNSDNVLAFTKRFDENADIKEMRNFVEEAKPKNLPYRCTHSKLLVDSHHRQLTCRLCGAVVEAFDWINAVTDGETKVDWELRGLRREITDHRQGLEKLKREEVNCKARIKNASFKLNDIRIETEKAEKELKFLTDRLEQVRGLRGGKA
ncbi:hypothetical protein AL485_18100 [Serratia liquefaciens]|uniref:hypothetical protein n=1 Tax=Serratia liquefaciens TaxID=614 RepID=UPI00076B21BD|nr:hypothetical protein [Serratia liquefaciens]AMH00923.1 hypothetical protein AL485_18100 [Serratia liquefaciens]